MAITVYDKGDLVRVSGAFTDSNSVAIDPDVIKFQQRDPNSDITTFVFSTDAELVRDSLGNYHVDVNANIVGRWWTRFFSTGSGQAAEEREFIVDESRF